MDAKERIVYVIDDDESVRKAFARLLRSANFRAETFASVEEFLRDPKQTGEACILADILMPDESGFTLQIRLAASGITLPVIVVSASDDAFVRERVRELGASAFFRKPVDDQALLDAIWWAISESKATKKGT